MFVCRHPTDSLLNALTQNILLSSKAQNFYFGVYRTFPKEKYNFEGWCNLFE